VTNESKTESIKVQGIYIIQQRDSNVVNLQAEMQNSREYVSVLRNHLLRRRDDPRRE
jgi:hypothetical protein